MDVLYGMILDVFSLALMRNGTFDDILVGQIFNIILKIASINYVIFSFDDTNVGTFGLGFVPAPELYKSALPLSKRSPRHEVFV